MLLKCYQACAKDYYGVVTDAFDERIGNTMTHTAAKLVINDCPSVEWSIATILF